MNIKKIIFPIVITICKIIFFLPYRVTGGIRGIDEVKYLNIIYSTPLIKENNCIDCFKYSLLVERAILESIIVFVLSIIITYIILKIFKKKSNQLG